MDMDTRTKKVIASVEAWNKKYPVGTKVSVLRDKGESKITVTRSEAWMLGSNSQHPGHTAVIKVDGISGGYLLRRVSAFKEDVMVTGSKGVELIAQERFRQKEEEGFDAEHDAEHTDGALAIAAACYVTDETKAMVLIDNPGPLGRGAPEYLDAWPWYPKWDKRGKDDRITLLIKAGALIAAEIDRLKALEG